MKAHTFRDPRQFKLAPPLFIDATRAKDYKRSVDEILAVSAGLTDRTWTRRTSKIGELTRTSVGKIEEDR